jgi:chemotaxis protein CheC
MSIDFSYDESEVLRELMNIAFGQAAADLSDLLDQLIGISIPGLSVMEPLDFRNHLIKMVEPIESLTISEQSFSGLMKGTGFLIFTDETPSRLCMLMNGEEPSQEDDSILDSTLIEVTNLVVGACLRKMMDLLKEKISFSHPGIMIKHNPMIPL